MTRKRLTNLVAFVVVTLCAGLSVAQEVGAAGEGTVTPKIPYDTLDDYGQWIDGDASAPLDAILPAGGGAGGGRATGCDMTFCQLYDLRQFGREADIVGLAMATTSWNVSSDTDCIWYDIPDEEHPFIVMNLFRLKTADDGTDRFEQIGMSHIKHGFYALGNNQCGGAPCTYEPGHSVGNWLGTGCTDTYGASLNAAQYNLGPRFEVNPWTGGWIYSGSHMDGGPSHDQIEHRLQVHDADLDAAGNPGATYYGEGYYVMLDDVDVMNSASWKPVTVSGSPGGTWSFGMSGYSTLPEEGFAIDAWVGATQTVLAQEPPIEFVSPDGRCVLAAKATELGGGMWHYEYALLNIDMDRQVGSFSIPISSDTSVSNVGFHAVEHHEEPFNTADPDAVAIDNAPWTDQVTTEAVTWSTTTNPLRWGMMYNFRFDADGPPTTTSVTLGMFRDATPSTVTGETIGMLPPPAACVVDPSLCGDENVCTDDVCDPDDPGANQNGCLNPPNTAPCDDADYCTLGEQCTGGSCSAGAYVTQQYADICAPFYDPNCDPPCPQPDLQDILCILDDFADGSSVDGCNCDGFRNTTDLFPCAVGDGLITLDDILVLVDHFGQTDPCGDPCP